METRIIKIDLNNIEDSALNEASEYLRSGKLVVFPTETVYGIGANALSEEAFKKIFIAKGRPSDNPLIVHVGSIKDIYKYVKILPENALKLAESFWPGPMTLVLKSNGIIPKSVYSNLDKVGFRIPSNKIALELLKLADVPVCAPSANISGKPSPTKVSHVIDDLNGKVDLIIDGEQCDYGVESTVIDIEEDHVTILRPGAITFEMISELIPNVKIADHLNEKTRSEKVLSPGMKYLHYTPKAKVIVLTSNDKRNKVINYIEKNNITNYQILCAKENEKDYIDLNYKIYGTYENSITFAHNLFDYFREADDKKIDYLFVESVSDDEIGMAVMNRLMRAGSEII